MINVDSSVYLLDSSFIDVLRIEFFLLTPTLRRCGISLALQSKDKNWFLFFFAVWQFLFIPTRDTRTIEFRGGVASEQ